ncbi:MAG TPA: excinuclease ABC subunit UvrC [Candidatus Acidoferrales bacterium]|nr:excinuclease ABC subunit UvrC [Candidatus Acidoferrales bacterium]
MDLDQKVSAVPGQPGVYLFKDAAGAIIYVGKAQSLRHRVRSYFAGSEPPDAKTGSLVREIGDLETIVVDNEKEALALENSLIKQHRPKFNILLRDDKTYPYVRFTAGEKYPRVYVTRRLVQDGSLYFGPYFPHRLAYRVVKFINKYFQVPSCHCDLTKSHSRPCPGFPIRRCLGPCMPNAVTDERYAEAARDTRMFLEGRRHDLLRSLRERMQAAAEEQRFEMAASYRDLLRTLEEMEEKQKIASARGDDTDVLAFHAEPPQVAANLFHLRGGQVVDRRDFYWEDLEEFHAGEFVSSLLKQLYLDSGYLPLFIHIPVEIDDRALLEDILSERAGRRVEIHVPQRGAKRQFLDLVEKNARHSFWQRFRVLRPDSKAIAAALQAALGLNQPPRRIESFDVSHIQGSDTVASMVVCEDGRMKKSDYRKFIIRGVPGNDDFASMREAVARRYGRLLREAGAMPGLILIDGGIGQLHAAALALADLKAPLPPLACIAKREEIITVHGREHQPIALDHHSPILHLLQQIRDETHRFAVTFHRHRRARRTLHSELEDIPGVGRKTVQALLRRFGSIRNLRQASLEEMAAIVPRGRAEIVFRRLRERPQPNPSAAP